MAQFRYHMPLRRIKINLLMIENVRALLAARGVDDKALAMYVGHKPAWLSKIMSGERGISLPDLDRVADFFGLTVAQLLSPGISPMTERRVRHRRSGDDRRTGDRRRVEPDRLHPVMPPFLHREYQDRGPDTNDGGEGGGY